MTIKIENYSFDLPQNLIASEPTNPREASRLLVFDSGKKEYQDKHFFDLGKFLKPNDLIITNNSKVFPARLIGKKETGGRVEVLILENKKEIWRAIIGGKIQASEKVILSKDFFCIILNKQGKEADIQFNLSGEAFWKSVELVGRMPIPPYIKNTKLSETELRREYQTVYAQNYGSAAAPTAGLHFSEELIGDLKDSGVNFASIDLHVGLGTFAPIAEDDIKRKKLHLENFSIPSSTIKKIISTRNTGGRIITVGTTTVRALESSATKILQTTDYKLQTIFGSTDIFIQPSDKFKIVDGLITNFHLPKSSLMMLVAAFIQDKTKINGQKKIIELYEYAIEKEYRFYSFGDAMLIL